MMGNYSLTAVFTKEPVVIAGAVRSILFVLVLLSLVTLDEKQLAGIALGLELVLGLFTRANSTSSSTPTLTEGTKVTVVTPEGEPNRVATV
ncbi:MAG TPA: hypothetical protein VGQ58_04585 [Candidatus Limnocylindrales bacterium]|nr:hypothetical protein [Candidatus Limnocylindrales bacterium]